MEDDTICIEVYSKDFIDTELWLFEQEYTAKPDFKFVNIALIDTDLIHHYIVEEVDGKYYITTNI